MRRLRHKFRLDHGHCGLAGRLDDAAYAIFGTLPILSKALSRKAECWQSYNRTAEQPIEIEGATNPTSSFLPSLKACRCFLDGSCASIYGAPVNKIDIGHVNIECAASWLSRARKFSAEQSKFRAVDRLTGNYYLTNR